MPHCFLCHKDDARLLRCTTPGCAIYAHVSCLETLVEPRVCPNCAASHWTRPSFLAITGAGEGTTFECIVPMGTPRAPLRKQLWWDNALCLAVGTVALLLAGAALVFHETLPTGTLLGLLLFEPVVLWILRALCRFPYVWHGMGLMESNTYYLPTDRKVLFGIAALIVVLCNTGLFALVYGLGSVMVHYHANLAAYTTPVAMALVTLAWTVVLIAFLLNEPEDASYRAAGELVATTHRIVWRMAWRDKALLILDACLLSVPLGLLVCTGLGTPLFTVMQRVNYWAILCTRLVASYYQWSWQANIAAFLPQLDDIDSPAAAVVVVQPRVARRRRSTRVRH